ALEAALRRDPRMLEARHALGLVYRRLGKETEASEQFRIARAQSAAAQRDRRLGYLQGEVQRNPMNPIVHYQLGCLYDELKEKASARAEFEAAASLDPTMPDPHERLAQLDERVNRPRKAQQERAIARRLSRELGSRETVPFRYHSASLRPASATASPSRMPAVHFTDVTEPAGIHFRHTNGGFGRKYLPET